MVKTFKDVRLVLREPELPSWVWYVLRKRPTKPPTGGQRPSRDSMLLDVDGNALTANGAALVLVG